MENNEGLNSFMCRRSLARLGRTWALYHYIEAQSTESNHPWLPWGHANACWLHSTPWPAVTPAVHTPAFPFLDEAGFTNGLLMEQSLVLTYILVQLLACSVRKHFLIYVHLSSSTIYSFSFLRNISYGSITSLNSWRIIGLPSTVGLPSQPAFDHWMLVLRNHWMKKVKQPGRLWQTEYDHLCELF